jgi:CheY-like chemotaxis protein/energy-coupling factor transporter ATP-binding protein EcfA2
VSDSESSNDAGSGHRPPGARELAARLAEKVVGQPGALEAIVPSVHLHLSGLAPEGRPVGVFLLLGPTGTGKTRTVEALAEVLHGDSRKVLRIECGEFQSDHEIAKLLGAPPGYVGHTESKPRLTQGALAEVLSVHCDLALVLFDEIEKAAPAMTGLLLGIFDRAELRLGDGSVVDFSKSLIFLTSNLGAREMMGEMSPALGFGAGTIRDQDDLRESLQRIGMRAVEKHFSPEFVNRIDAVVTYRPLDTTSVVAILDQQVTELQQHVHTRLGARSFEIEVTREARDFLVERGISPEYGARELRRVIHRHLTQPLAALVAEGEVPAGATVTVDRTVDALSLAVHERTIAGAPALRTILVVDDNAAIVRWLMHVLGREGFDVIPASGVEEARAQMAKRYPDVALIDHVLPDGEGVALAGEIRRARRDTPIVMMSGFELDQEERSFCLRHDIPRLAKPFLAEELLKTLASLNASPPHARAQEA